MPEIDKLDEIPNATKIGIAEQELQQYLVMRYQAELRHRVASRAEDERMKEAITKDLVRIESAIDTLKTEIAALKSVGAAVN